MICYTARVCRGRLKMLPLLVLVNNMYEGRLEDIRRIPVHAQVLPESKALRGRVISFLHRLVECLGERLLPFLPAALSALLPVTADASDVTDVSALLSQFAQRYKAALAPLLAKARTRWPRCAP